MLGKQGDFSGAIAQQRQALALHLAIAKQDPVNTNRFEVATTRDELGFFLDEIGQRKKADHEFQLSAAILEELVLADPANVEWRQHLEGVKEDL